MLCFTKFWNFERWLYGNRLGTIKKTYGKKFEHYYKFWPQPERSRPITFWVMNFWILKIIFFKFLLFSKIHNSKSIGSTTFWLAPKCLKISKLLFFMFFKIVIEHFTNGHISKLEFALKTAFFGVWSPIFHP